MNFKPLNPPKKILVKPWIYDWKTSLKPGMVLERSVQTQVIFFSINAPAPIPSLTKKK